MRLGRVILAPLVALLLGLSLAAAPVANAASPHPKPTTDGHPLFVYRMFGAGNDPNLITKTLTNRYGAFLMSPSMTAVAAKVKSLAPNDAVYMYKDISSTRTGGTCNPQAIGLDWGVDYCDTDANHPGWFLKLNGQRFEYNGYPGAWETDPAATNYAKRWSSNVLADLQSNPNWDGVFADNALADIRAYVPGGGFPDKYQTVAAGQQAYTTFLNAAGPSITGAGYGFMSNESGVRLYDGLWNTYTTPQTGGYDEFWTTFGKDGSGQPQNLSEYGTVGWQAQLAEATWSIDHAKFSVFVGQASGGTCILCQRYGYASYLLVNDGTIGYQEGNKDALPGDYVGQTAMYRWDLGLPTAARSQPRTHLYTRPFAKGLVYVNTDGTTGQTVSLGGTYLDESGQAVTSVTVGPTRARILRTP